MKKKQNTNTKKKNLDRKQDMRKKKRNTYILCKPT